MKRLFEKVDRLDDHLSAAEVLSSHGILVPPSQIKNTENDKEKIHLLLTRLARTVTRQ